MVLGLQNQNSSLFELGRYRVFMMSTHFCFRVVHVDLIIYVYVSSFYIYSLSRIHDTSAFFGLEIMDVSAQNRNKQYLVSSANNP
jgi:hypothetical protein